MQQENNKLKSSFTGNSLYIFAAKFFPALAFSIVWMYASRETNSDEYGLFQKFWSQLFVFTAIGTIGFPVFVLTYAPAKVVGILQQIKPRTIILFIGLILLLGTVFGYLQFLNEISIAITAGLLFIAFVAVVLADSLLIVFQSFKAIIGINFLYALLFCSIHIANINHGFELRKLLLWILILCLGRLIICLIFITKKYKYYSNQLTIIDSDDWEKIKKLWLQLGINDIINVLFRWVDKFILSLLLTKEIFAIYFNGTIEIPFLPILFAAISSAAVQHWANYLVAHNPNDKIALLHYSSRILSSIMFPLFFFFIFFRIEFLTLVFSTQYVSAVWIFVCTQLVLPVRAYPFTALLQSYHRGDIINKGAIIDFVLACILMYPLYLWLGLPGVALSFVISTYWQAGYYLMHSARLVSKPVGALVPFKMLGIKFLLFGFLFGIAYYLSNFLSSNIHYTFFSGLIVLILSAIIALWLDWRQTKNNDE